jgi:shikimate dehydrogenase
LAQLGRALQTPDKYAVLGNPIAHSKSPLIHAAFAKQTQQYMQYERVLAPLDGFEATLRGLVARGFKGANVTVPFKFEAFALCNSLSKAASAAGAVNTLTFQAGQIHGDNTDGIGLINDIQQHQQTALKGSRILVLGAGGAAQGILLPLLNTQPANVVIANRTLEKAQEMVDKSGDTARVSANTFTDLSGAFDVIINATSAGLTDTALPIPDSIFTKNSLAYDMMYGKETPFMAQARAKGAQVADGLGMLVEQAAEAFFIWRGVRPETAPVMAMLRAL